MQRAELQISPVVVISSRPRLSTLLCTLVTNYGCRMLILVSSAYATGFQEAKHETSGGEHRLTLNLTDSSLRPETVGKFVTDVPSNNVWKGTVFGAWIWRGEGVVWCFVNSLTDIWIQTLSESSRTGVSTKLEYTAATGKEVLILLQSAAGVMPVPLLQDAIGVASKVVQLCEVGWIPPWKVARQLMKMLSLGCIGYWTKGQRAARKGRLSHDRYLAPRNTQKWRR